MLTFLFGHGPLITAVTMLAVSPGSLFVLAPLAEGRRLRIRDQYAALLYGDIALAATAAVGTQMWGAVGSVVHGHIGTAQWLLVTLGLIIGGVQARAEFRSRTYSLGELLSPTKLWHQGVIVPLLFASTVLSLTLAVLTFRTHPAAAAVAVTGVLAWALTMDWDRSHPRRAAHISTGWYRLNRQDCGQPGHGRASPRRP